MTMVSNRLAWAHMDFNIFSWISLISEHKVREPVGNLRSGLYLLFIEIWDSRLHGFSWISMDFDSFHRLPWIFLDFHGFLWVSMDIHDYYGYLGSFQHMFYGFLDVIGFLRISSILWHIVREPVGNLRTGCTPYIVRFDVRFACQK